MKKNLFFTRTRHNADHVHATCITVREPSAGCKCLQRLAQKFSRRLPCTLNTTFGCNGNASNAAVWVAVAAVEHLRAMRRRLRVVFQASFTAR